MKNALLIAGLFLGSVVAAVVVWAAVGGSGGDRRAALVEPTGRGSIGVLSIGGARGGEAIPVRSFDWSPNQLRPIQVIEVLRDSGELSPEIFSFATHGAASDVVLDLVAPGAAEPYLRYQFTNTTLTQYRGGGKYEKLLLRGLPSDVTAGRSPAPEPEPSDIVGYMTLGETRVPILAFESEFALIDSPSILAVIRRPLDQLTPTLNEAFDAESLLGTVTIELQTPGEQEPRVTYELSAHVDILGLTDSAAAGVTPTEEVKLRFNQMRVTRGSRSTCYSRQTGHNC